MTYSSAANPAAARAASAAAPPFFDPVDLVNADVAVPAAETYPGAVDPAIHSGETDYEPTTPGGVGGEQFGDWQGQPFRETVPEQPQGGGVQETSWMSGHDAPQAAWDSSAGEPFAPSGALDPDVHAEDPGAVYKFEYVIPAAIGSLTRRTQVGQTTVRNGSGDQALKDNVVSPNDREDLDQYQVHRGEDTAGYEPWAIPYAERPVQNNVAWEAQPMQVSQGPYVPSGFLPDRSPYDAGLAVAYEAPPDPYVTTAAVGSGDSGIGGGWLAG